VSGNPFYLSPFWRRLRRAALARDGYRCAVEGCPTPACIADHIVTRPRGVAVPCPEDRLDNLRSLCGPHDAQIKEDQSGKRRRGGRAVVRGCDPHGWPFFRPMV
jgi:hypothetical protein